jgi:hypothetical protein
LAATVDFWAGNFWAGIFWACNGLDGMVQPLAVRASV